MSREILIGSILKRVKKKGFTDLEVRDLLKSDSFLKEGVQWISIDAFESELRKAIKKIDIQAHKGVKNG